MDALAHLLNDVRTTGALFGRTIMSPPWSVRFEDSPPLMLVTMLRGDGWILPDNQDPVTLGHGDVAIVAGLTSFSIADAPQTRTPPLYTVRGLECNHDLALGVRTCGDQIDGPNVLLTGSYQVHGRVCERLLSVLPKVLTVPNDGDLCPVLDLTTAEIEREDPGQQAVLDRLLDLLLLTALREWFARPEACSPPWYRALSDPVVGRALRLLHDEPARPWTVATLAEEAGVSRATFARRFTELVGEAPMSYLTTWRLSLAIDLLQSTDAKVETIAEQVGYRSGFGLSVAFKRVLGTRPSDYRAGARMGDGAAAAMGPAAAATVSATGP